MMDRRELLHRAALLLGGALSSGTVAGVLSGCVSTPPNESEVRDAAAKTFLTPDEMSIVTAMSDQIIPRTDTPGAIDVGVPSYVDRMLAGYYQARERDIFRQGMRAVMTDAAEYGGKPFAELTSDQQVKLMTEYDRLAYDQNRRVAADPKQPPHFFRLMKELTIIGYCTSEAGATKFLKYAAIPGPYRGDIPYSEVGKAWQS
jgi:glucoside 3-dehydrogenase (cytochrome c) hitch-hiker subunit